MVVRGEVVGGCAKRVKGSVTYRFPATECHGHKMYSMGKIHNGILIILYGDRR